MTAPTVNAYYDPQLNDMVFPAGILQPPFYSVDASIPVNLGGMGVVVGHELTHGFDDQGAQFDADGNLDDWWQPETEKQFKQRTQCVVDQYCSTRSAGAEAQRRAHGRREHRRHRRRQARAHRRTARCARARPTPSSPTASPRTSSSSSAFGQAWCAKARPDYEKLLATVDVHSPRAVARQRRAVGDAGVREGVPLQGRHEDAPGQAVRRLVTR